jgi:hypothetical protein
MKALLAATAAVTVLFFADATPARVYVAAKPTRVTEHWTCSAIGFRERGPIPAPQRIPFTSNGPTKSDAEQGALDRCKRDTDVTTSSCKIYKCWRS